jgi:hypothetical protein
MAQKQNHIPDNCRKQTHLAGAASLALNVGMFTLDSNPKPFNGSALGTRFEAA